MKRGILLMTLIGCVLLFLCGQPEVFAQEYYRPTVTVYGFESKASSGFWHDFKWDVGTGMAEMLIDALVATGKFDVVERVALADITTEQDLYTAGRVAEEKAARTGELLGAEYIVRGTITEFDVRKAGGAGGVSIKGFSFGLAQSTAHVAGTIRVYDATTGRVLGSRRFKRSVPATGVDFGWHKGAYGVDLGGFKKTPLGEATHFMIADMADYISGVIPTTVPRGYKKVKPEPVKEAKVTGKEPPTAALKNQYWLKSAGIGSALYKVNVYINDTPIATITRQGTVMDVTRFVNPGPNKIKFDAEKRALGLKRGTGTLEIVLGPGSKGTLTETLVSYERLAQETQAYEDEFIFQAE